MELTQEKNCPLCNRPITVKLDSEIINCINCKKKIMYKYCFQCSGIIYFYKIDYDGYNIKCPYISCGVFGCSVKCEYCNKKIFYKFVEKELPHLQLIKGPATYLVFVDHSFYSSNSSEFCRLLRELDFL